VRIEASERREIEELTREAAAKKALVYVIKAFETLEKVMESAESDQARVAAAKEVLDRALGKPREAPPEPASDAMKDITPSGLNGSGHKPPIDLEDWKMVGT
jgi:hypothetical protein